MGDRQNRLDVFRLVVASDRQHCHYHLPSRATGDYPIWDGNSAKALSLGVLYRNVCDRTTE